MCPSPGFVFMICTTFFFFSRDRGSASVISVGKVDICNGANQEIKRLKKAHIFLAFTMAHRSNKSYKKTPRDLSKARIHIAVCTNKSDFLFSLTHRWGETHCQDRIVTGLKKNVKAIKEKRADPSDFNARFYAGCRKVSGSPDRTIFFALRLGAFRGPVRPQMSRGAL